MQRLSLFLDIDGTILEIAGHPESVTVPDSLPPMLRRLETRLGGALALASGRNIATIDRLLSPYRGATIGVHGLEQRTHGGEVFRTTYSSPPPALRKSIAEILRRFPGAFVEDKGVAIAVHERGSTAEARALSDALNGLCSQIGADWHCIAGRSVFEIKPRAVNKGTALESVMRSPPFSGTLPVAIGDDTTDIDLFNAAMRFGGMAVAVGDRIADAAKMHLQSPTAVLHLLQQWSVSADGESLADVEEMVRLAGRL